MIILKARKLKNLFEKTAGLIGKNIIEPVYLQTRLGIHTFGVREQIDIVILNNNYQVQSIKENLKPCRIFFWNPLFVHVLELPKGTVKKKRLEIGDKINLKLV